MLFTWYRYGTDTGCAFLCHDCQLAPQTLRTRCLRASGTPTRTSLDPEDPTEDAWMQAWVMPVSLASPLSSESRAERSFPRLRVAAESTMRTVDSASGRAATKYIHSFFIFMHNVRIRLRVARQRQRQRQRHAIVLDSIVRFLVFEY